MGNLSFLIPTKNQQEFTLDGVAKLLTAEFPNLTFTKDEKFDGLTVYMTKDEGYVNEFYFNSECYVLNYEQDILELEEMGMVDLVNDLKTLQQMAPDLNNCVQMTHEYKFKYREAKRNVEIFLHKYFGLYIFDEGIHPDYIPPSYIYKKK